MNVNSHNSQLIKVILIIFIGFLACFLPSFVVNMADPIVFQKDGKPATVEFPTLHILTEVLVYASGVINPFIYGFMNKQFHAAFVKVYRDLVCCRNGKSMAFQPERGAPPSSPVTATATSE